MNLEWMKKSVLCPIGILVVSSLLHTVVVVEAAGDKTRVVPYRKNQISSHYRPPCETSNDCSFKNSFCNEHNRKCQCDPDYVQVGSFVNKSYISHQPMTCVRLARLDERCVSDHQCIVDYSECRLTNQPVSGGGGGNLTAHYCKCQSGHTVLEHDTVDVILDGRTYRTRPICSWERPAGVSWLSTLILLILLVIFILIVTFVALVRYQRWRNQPYPVTITSLANSNMHGHGHGMNSHHHHHGSASPPPMGSTQAEFENDFIQVFPMHHLEPMPDKNVHAYIIK